jgi:peptidyl-dipeptidase Dcp
MTRLPVGEIVVLSKPPANKQHSPALERSGQLLTRMLRVFAAVTSANTNERLQAFRQMRRRDSLRLDLPRRRAVRARATSTTGATVTKPPGAASSSGITWISFAPAHVSRRRTNAAPAGEPEEATLHRCQTGLLEANKAASIMVEDVAQLDGLSPEEIASAAQLAAERGTPDRWALAIQNTTQQPALAFLRDRALRCRLFEASVHRADRDGPVDTREIVVRLAELRAERAALLGYENAAAYVLDDQMAKTPQAAMSLLHQVGEHAAAKAGTTPPGSSDDRRGRALRSRAVD